MKFSSWLINEGSRFPTSYHVTYLKNLDGIEKEGLVPRGGISPWQKPHLNIHSQKGVFHCQDYKCVRHWIDEMAEQSYNISDHPVSDQLIPMILRFNVNRNSVMPDKIANSETLSKGHVFTTKNINNAGLEVWNGRQWSSDLNPDSINVHAFYDMDGYEDEQEILTVGNGYPLPPELGY